jgi:hypothetical protein
MPLKTAEWLQGNSEAVYISTNSQKYFLNSLKNLFPRQKVRSKTKKATG